MENIIIKLIENVLGTDKEMRYDSYLALMEMTEGKVDWVYKVWNTRI